MSEIQKDRKPLLDKLEPRNKQAHHAFNREAQEWSKTGRDFAKMIMDMIRWFFE